MQYMQILYIQSAASPRIPRMDSIAFALPTYGRIMFCVFAHGPPFFGGHDVHNAHCVITINA